MREPELSHDRRVAAGPRRLVRPRRGAVSESSQKCVWPAAKASKPRCFRKPAPAQFFPPGLLLDCSTAKSAPPHPKVGSEPILRPLALPPRNPGRDEQRREY